MMDVCPGDMLLSVSLTSPVTSIVMDNAETGVWVGDRAGDIHRVCLLSPPRDVSVTSDSQGVTSLSRGHEASVTHLSVSCDGLSLASGDSSGQPIGDQYYLWSANDRACYFQAGSTSGTQPPVRSSAASLTSPPSPISASPSPPRLWLTRRRGRRVTWSSSLIMSNV